jgi:uncharacterized protein (TIGR00369 family)
MGKLYAAQPRKNITSEVIEPRLVTPYCRSILRMGEASMSTELNTLTERHRGTLSELLGVRFVEVSHDRVVAELSIKEALTTVGGSLHGGALMVLADTVGAAATMLNLPSGASTTTLESKTNFIAANRSGTVRAEATPLHRGKRTMVWQTRVTDGTGRLLSLTIQTQMVLEQ